MTMKNTNALFEQTGAVLPVSMIFLLLLTMLGVTAVKTNILGEKMVNNDRQYKVALHAAEFVLREGENQIDTAATYSSVVTTDSTASSNRGLYLASAAPSNGWWDGVNWGNTDQIKASSSSTSDRPLKYIVEQLPASSSGRDSKEASTELSRNYYRVTSRAYVTGIAAKVMLQSTYKK